MDSKDRPERHPCITQELSAGARRGAGRADAGVAVRGPLSYRSDRDDDLAARVAGADVAQGVGEFLKGVRALDDGMQCVRLEHVPERIEVLSAPAALAAWTANVPPDAPLISTRWPART
ncbi:MAG: hypothetical protein WD358_05385 [Nitriliruptoraceae bacterium]